jgi:zinc transport system substrate-binding protein
MGTVTRLKYLLGLILWALMLQSCSKINPQPENKLPTPRYTSSMRVVTTVLPIYWFTKAVVGDVTEVQILIPPGTEVHEYQATPANVQAIAQADILIKNGLGLEEFLDDTIKNTGNSKLKIITASEKITPIEETAENHDHKADKDHEHQEGNPHVWLDPTLAKRQVENIRDGLILADPKNKENYQKNAQEYINKLEKLDLEFEEKLKPYQGCTYITFHNAYPYLAKRYELKQIAVVSIPEDNPLPEDVEKVVKTVKKYRVKTLLGEPNTENKLLKSLAKDLKINISSLESMETGEMSPDYYFTAMNKNIKTLEEVCK